MGVAVRGAGTSEITIEGRPALGGAQHTVIPDRIEAGTYMVAGAITGGSVMVVGARGDHLDAFTAKLREAGVAVRESESGIRIEANGKLHAADVKTMPYPGFATDLQAQFMALMTRATGTSTITETIFENRFLHAQELVRMGADIRAEGNRALVRGPSTLSGARKHRGIKNRRSSTRSKAHSRAASFCPVKKRRRIIRMTGCGLSSPVAILR